MSRKYLGDHIDIHCGGIDHIPVHHTNEIAQSEAIIDDKWVKYWLHSEFLIMNNDKMSKSDKSFITLQNIIDKGFSPLDYRYLVLNSHYQNQLFFSWQALEGARISRNNLLKKIKSLKLQQKDSYDKTSDINKKESQQELEKFHKHLSYNLNSPKALAQLWLLINSSQFSSQDKIYLIQQFDKILALNLFEEEQDSKKHITEEEKNYYDQLIEQRNLARQKKDFVLADKIRDKLLAEGVQIFDNSTGTSWQKK